MSRASLAQQMYARSPVFAQDLAVSLYGLNLRWREYGREFERLLGEFEAQARFSPSEMEAWQGERLQRMLRHAFEHVPWYRETFRAAGVTPDTIRSLGDIAKLPITPARVLADNPNSLVALSASRADRIRGHTSGTTGQSKTILYDRNVCRVKNVVEWRMRRSAGVDVGDPVANLVGKMVVPISQRKPPFWRRNRALNQLFLSVFHFAPAWYQDYISALERFGAVGIDGYPSTVSMLAEALLLDGRRLSMRAAFVSSEVLVPWQRTAIEQGLDCAVFDYYGMAERALFATECEHHRGLHVNSDFGLLELLDENDEPVPPGVSGRVVITGWHNHTMPFIRFQTSDWATWATEPCPCGRPFPLLRSVDGREEDQVATPDGRFLDVSFAYGPFTAVQNKLVESQIYQEASGRIALRVVPKPGFTAADAEKLVRGIQAFVGDSAVVEVETWQEIPRTTSGKFRWLVSEVPRRLQR